MRTITADPDKWPKTDLQVIGSYSLSAVVRTTEVTCGRLGLYQVPKLNTRGAVVAGTYAYIYSGHCAVNLANIPTLAHVLRDTDSDTMDEYWTTTSCTKLVDSLLPLMAPLVWTRMASGNLASFST
jgi:hypothetical protein